ncbi:hypothetical protein HNP84_008327 [Thermocatellispora tengchongensis]|uniref:Uncharacterized protein n=1 Tax=Thermocatellispora tengchongensis TaxID=1073253 RepID=A0A840PKV7_9ACTN|nr:DUF3040 domain-containing protein [Thermocatellispora tengchongensis]MBB5138573.1 hypothetical protein [Thermocatellispora tengchongensis]
MKGRLGSLRRERRVLDEMERVLRRECPELEAAMTLLDAHAPRDGRGPDGGDRPAATGQEVGAWELVGVLAAMATFVMIMIAVTLWG